ncbi:hypothetical protein WOLCODRAFT_160952 [Wolfiporia cocos MD-104 SS10]|uniref:DUF7598 domain-containing protein n=1 Tax=Wolfiporia cocos (strain MD-104) TaxID=742152 RepID=A0A2H3JNT8_WOLCO|nr:hypothetical protein WOLCODRAFT_160952 [Wolfiporia cocos MD-104 SS10]
MLPPRSYVFIGLNVVRALSILSLVLVFASSIFVMVRDIEAFNDFQAQANSTSYENCDYIPNSDVPNQPAGIFWAILNRILIIFEVIVLICSEMGWPAAFFERFFPVLGESFGLGPLGIFECLISTMILSHHVDDFTLVAAFLLFALGCVNIFLGLVFRERAKPRRALFAWRERVKDAKDILPTHARPSSALIDNLWKGGDEKSHGGVDEWGRRLGYGFGRSGEKKAGLKGFKISKPLETLPRYAPSTRPERPASASDRSHSPEPKFQSSATAI